MGIIAITTTEKFNDTTLTERRVKRLVSNLKSSETVFNKGIPIEWYDTPLVLGLSSLSFKPILQLQRPHILPMSTNIDIFWHSSGLFSRIQSRDQTGVVSCKNRQVK